MCLTFEPIGDQGLLIRAADEQTALRFASAVRAAALPWVEDVVSAYLTVAVYFDYLRIDPLDAWDCLAQLPLAEATSRIGKVHSIPCCYELGPDLPRVAAHTGLTTEAVIALHTSCEFTVYAIGFCPGFPYLGYLPEPLCGVPRLPTPRLRVEPGSVGITGRQTGIYPLVCPGGWHLIGRTPICLVDPARDYFPLAVGDRVRFVRIDEPQYRHLAATA